MASDVENYMLAIEHDKPAAESIAKETAAILTTQPTNLITVVQSLGEFINDENPSIRTKASSYLTAVINALPERFLSRQQIQVLCQFFCDRGSDGDGMAGVDGLSVLVGLDRFGGESVEIVSRALFADFQDLQVRSQSQRYQILSLLNDLMLKHRKVLREMGDEFIVGIVDLVSGEKDPRNLMLIFSMLKVVMLEWDILNHVEPLFDAVFCYFPITFRPPPNDPYGITAQDLKDRLRECIASSSFFAPHAFPALLEKLDSTSINVKRDVLQAIAACSESYSPITMSQYSVTLWDSLKYEILAAQEDDLVGEALTALRAIARQLSSGLTSTGPTTILAQYLRPIMKECNEKLQEPQQKQAKPAGTIISSLAAASDYSFTLIIRAVLAPMLTIYQDTDGYAKQRALLEVVVGLFDSAIEVYGEWRSLKPKAALENPLNAFKDKVLDFFSQALMSTNKSEVSFRVVALKGLLGLARTRDFLQDNEIGLIVQYLNEIVLVEESQNRDDLKQEAIKGLATISKLKPSLIMDITFPAFMATLPDSDSGVGKASYITTLEGLAQISVEKEIFDTLIRRLLFKLDMVLRGDSSPAYPRDILSTILYVLERKGVDGDSNLGSYYDKIVVALFRQTVTPIASGQTGSALNDDLVLDTLGRLANFIVRALPRERQIEACENVYKLFSADLGFEIIPFNALGDKKARAQTLILSTYLLAAIPKDLNPALVSKEDSSMSNSDTSDLQRLLLNLVDLSHLPQDFTPATVLAIHRQIALLANKFLPPDFTTSQQCLNELIDKIESAAHPHSEKRIVVIRTAFHLARALISRLVPQTTEILTRLLNLVSHSEPNISVPSAHGFSLLLAPDPVLIPTNRFTIRLLSRQKVFAYVVPELSARFRASTSTAQKSNYLIALSGLLSQAPQSVVVPELPTLLPLLLQSLDLDTESDPTHSVKNATLETLTLVVREVASSIDESGHTNSLVTRLLKTASSPISSNQHPPSWQPSSPPKTRLLSLRLLSLFPTCLRQTDLLPLKLKVVKVLGHCCDDPKRGVRKEAVSARANWLAMDAPGEADD